MWHSFGESNMKTLLSVMGGAITITEQNGVFSLNWNESLGGGQAAGVLKGSGSIQLSGQQLLELGENALNEHLPASAVPVAKVVEGIANSAITAAE